MIHIQAGLLEGVRIDGLKRPVGVHELLGRRETAQAACAAHYPAAHHARWRVWERRALQRCMGAPMALSANPVLPDIHSLLAQVQWLTVSCLPYFR